MTDALPPARSFGPVAEAYDRGRPSYPREAAVWLAGTTPTTVLEVGAGTGKLTEVLLALGHDVLATDPDPAMLAVLAERLPDVRVAEAPAEAIPLPDGCVDVVVAAQSFHWFDHERALPEIARVLRPGGELALAWNHRDERIPWVRRLGALIDTPGEQLRDPTAVLDASGLFGEVTTALHRFWQRVDREVLRDLVASRSAVATLGARARGARMAEVTTLYDDLGRGAAGLQLPYECHCFKAPVLDTAPAAIARRRALDSVDSVDPVGSVDSVDPVGSVGSVGSVDSVGSGAAHDAVEDTGPLLIDLR